MKMKTNYGRISDENHPDNPRYMANRTHLGPKTLMFNVYRFPNDLSV